MPARRPGLQVLLVSGGFTPLRRPRQARLKIDFARSNILELESGPNWYSHRPPGRPVLGDICDGAEKRRTMLEVASRLGISPEQCIAMGDGANDLPMMAPPVCRSPTAPSPGQCASRPW